MRKLSSGKCSGIKRLVGRRFFIFPSMSLTLEQTEDLRKELMQRAGRSVVLVPSERDSEALTCTSSDLI